MKSTRYLLAVPAALALALAGCGGSTGNSDTELNNAKQQLSQQLQLSTKPASTIDDWNGCLKVQYTDASGHNNVALYDPDTLRLVNQLS